ncbi:MAG: hypothetical protein FIB08_16845 [Candidatus Methanoperedens sp.]|nr:hypothetical protein [Candidatus Methanoperedens sp.]
MRIIRLAIILTVLAAVFTTAAYAAEANFSASSLTAKDVDCKKCHTDTPHVIHANKPVDCVQCHGDKLTVAIPQCTKCHDGPIHQVHAGKVATQTCSYCHKDIQGIHNALTSDAVCSHCHKDLIEVHGQDNSCTKCHKTPPNIVKPLKSPEMTLVCQNCHPATSVATIHGEATDKKGCYNCHKGTSKAQGSEVPHIIHATKVECKGCHEENGKVVVPQCTRCHDIDALHAFNKIGRLNSQSGLQCSICHPEISQGSSPQAARPTQATQAPAETIKAESTPGETGGAKIPGFEAALTIGVLIAGYMARRRMK